MHPTVRVVTFLVFAGFLAAGGVGRLGVAILLLALVYALAGAPSVAGLRHALVRLRFLWLSLVILYLWFTPGDALWPALGAWSPTVQGAAQGAVRIGVLALMVAAAQLLLQTTGTAQLVAAVHRLSRPLQWLGLNRDRFALRLVLVLETVPRLADVHFERPPTEVEREGRFARHVAALNARLHGALAAAAAAGPRQVELPPDSTPPLWQWLYPTAVAMVMIAAGVL